MRKPVAPVPWNLQTCVSPLSPERCRSMKVSPRVSIYLIDTAKNAPCQDISKYSAQTRRVVDAVRPGDQGETVGETGAATQMMHICQDRGNDEEAPRRATHELSSMHRTAGVTSARVGFVARAGVASPSSRAPSLPPHCQLHHPPNSFGGNFSPPSMPALLSPLRRLLAWRLAERFVRVIEAIRDDAKGVHTR